MNLRLPIVAGIVTVAAGAALVRGWQSPSVPHPLTAPGALLDVAALPGSAPHRARVVIYVAGAVARSGVFTLPAGGRAVDAVRAAGGATGEGDLVAVNLAEPLTDGEEIVVPRKDDPVVPRATRAAQVHRTHRRHRAKKRRAHHRRGASAGETAEGAPSPNDVGGPSDAVDINRAGPSELETLPGIGHALAERIITFRALNGPFASVDDLLDVGGMTQGRLDAIGPYLTPLP